MTVIITTITNNLQVKIWCEKLHLIVFRFQSCQMRYFFLESNVSHKIKIYINKYIIQIKMYAMKNIRMSKNYFMLQVNKQIANKNK